MCNEIERTTLVTLTNFRFRPVDVRWVELEVQAPFSKKRQTKLQLRDGKLFVCESDAPGYSEDVATIRFTTDPDNWIRGERNLKVAEEEV
jgi:hypothetical protein